MGMARVPEVYVMQAGGTLNALASKFMRANIVVLFSELIEACDDDTGARDMIIAHELGHLHAGHLRWTWFLLPGSMVPFLGTALSRAREYTCDRYGAAGLGEIFDDEPVGSKQADPGAVGKLILDGLTVVELRQAKVVAGERRRHIARARVNAGIANGRRHAQRGWTVRPHRGSPGSL